MKNHMTGWKKLQKFQLNFLARPAFAWCLVFFLQPIFSGIAPAHSQNGKDEQLAALMDAFTFVRVHWEGKIPYYSMQFFRNGEPPWAHDYPTAERNMYTALRALTSMKVSGRAEVKTLQDDAIFNYPILYICEIGHWKPSDEEAERLGEYLRRGGFLIVDDFRGRLEIANLNEQLRRAVPEFTQKSLRADHPIFHCFFEFDHLVRDSPYRDIGYIPQYFGWFDENDRLGIVVNYNNDIGDGWEWPDQDRFFSAEAFKLGINYLIYSMTH